MASTARTPLPSSPKKRRRPGPYPYPDPDPSLLATPPSPPPRWSWRCHRCRIWFPVAVARCLHCSHRTCTAKTALALDGSVTAADTRLPRSVCRSEFDYRAWAAWNQWRRAVAIASDAGRGGAGGDDDGESADAGRMFAWTVPSAQQRREQAAADRTKRFAANAHDCSRDCDWPSQCRNLQWEMYLQQVAEETELSEPTSSASEDDDCVMEGGEVCELPQSPTSPPPSPESDPDLDPEEAGQEPLDASSDSTWVLINSDGSREEDCDAKLAALVGVTVDKGC